jgi:hypothetical protein
MFIVLNLRQASHLPRDFNPLRPLRIFRVFKLRELPPARVASQAQAISPGEELIQPQVVKAVRVAGREDGSKRYSERPTRFSREE